MEGPTKALNPGNPDALDQLMLLRQTEDETVAEPTQYPDLHETLLAEEGQLRGYLEKLEWE